MSLSPHEHWAFAATLAALRNCMGVALTEQTVWIGGQLTSQAVAPVEHPWIQQFGGDRVEQVNRECYKKTPLVDDPIGIPVVETAFPKQRELR